MIDVLILAQHAVAWLAANHVGAAVASGAAKKAGEDAWKLLQAKFTAADEEKTLDKFQANPDGPGIKTRLEGTLHELLASDPHFAAELQKLLEAEKPAGIHQEVHATDSKVAQVAGNRNKITIG